jgi:hypothetical protein
MKAVSDFNPNFSPGGSALQQIFLQCNGDCEVDDVISAYVQGIKVGQVNVQGSFKAGDKVSLPIKRLPLVDLPAAIRLSSLATTTGDIEAMVLKSPDAAMALVGPGEITVERLELSQGMLRGFAFNRVNGLHVPMVFARMNNLLVRPVTVERPRLLDDGGCSFSFWIQLYPADLGENGFAVDLHVVGDEVPIASFHYVRQDADELPARVVALESRLTQLQQAASLQIASITADFRKRLEAQQERIDAFIDYASCLMFDQLATEAVEVAGAKALNTDHVMSDRMAAFRALINSPTSSPSPAAATPAPARVMGLGPDSDAFNLGWHDLEADSQGEFRWMNQNGMVLNPAPERPVERLSIGVRHVFKVRKPMVRVFLDAEEVAVRVVAARGICTFDLIVERRPDEPALPPFQMLRIESFVAGSPSEGGDSSDSRILSIAVANVTLEYADGAKP